MAFALIRKDLRLVLGTDVAELALHCEAIHLRLRQWVGASELDGVLGGDHEKHAVEIVADAFDGHLAFAHRLQQGALGAGRGAVYLICKQDIGEDRAFVKTEFLGSRIENRYPEDVGWQQIWSELHTLELRAVDGFRDGLCKRCFPCAREILQQHMAAGEHARQDSTNCIFLPPYHRAYRLFQFIRQFRLYHVVPSIFGIARRVSTSIFGEMSIITQRGDDGETDLMFGKRIAKTSLRFTALGTIDELNAAIGLARAADSDGKHTVVLDRLQNLLFALMGQLACLPDDQAKYLEKGYSSLLGADLEWLTETAQRIEGEGVKFTHWAVPGAEGSMARAHLDFARTVARRAERDVLLLHENGGEVPQTVRLFLNRISDLLWILARSEK